MQTAKHRADKYKLRPQEELYITLADLDFTWRPEEVHQVRRLWLQGISLPEIAQAVRDKTEDAQYETAILLIDLARRGKINERPGGVYGGVT